VAVASHKGRLSVWREGDVTGPGLRVAQLNLARWSELVACNRKNRHRTFAAIGHQRQSAGIVDRHTGCAEPRFDSVDNRRRPNFKIDHRKLVVGNGLFWIGGVNLEGPGHKREAFVTRYRNALRWPHNAGRCFHFAQQLRRRDTKVDNAYGIGRWIVGHDIYAVNQHRFVVIRRDENLRRSAYTEQRQRSQSEAKPRRSPIAGFHDASPARLIVAKHRPRRAATRDPQRLTPYGRECFPLKAQPPPGRGMLAPTALS